MDWLVLVTLWLPCQRHILLVWQYPGWNWRAIVAIYRRNEAGYDQMWPK